MNALEKIRKTVKNESDEDDWKYHIVPVVNYAKKLAKILKADEEIVELAALLHDIGRLKFGVEDHNITGVPEAERILKEYNYPEKVIDEVKHCVESHKGSKKIPPRTTIAKIISNADAMAHFDVLPPVFFYRRCRKSSFDKDKWIDKKIEREWNKKLTLPEARKMMEDKLLMMKEVDCISDVKKAFSEQLKSTIKEKDAVISGKDVEALHQMRVSSRRIRASLRVLSKILPKKKAEKWILFMRKVGRALGDARQIDMQIKLFNSMKDNPDNPDNHGYTAGKEKIISFLENKRTFAQEEIVKILEDTKTGGLFSDFSVFLETLESKDSSSEDKFFAPKNKIIFKRLSDLLKYKSYVKKPLEIKKLHLMRISAKNLRYTLEILRPFYSVKIDKAIRSSTRIQDLLGDLHEFDVCVLLLDELASQNREDKDFLQTASYLKEKFRGQREITYRKFVSAWEKSEKENVWENLAAFCQGITA